MSLKAFHLIFITAASAMAFGCGIWALRNYWSPGGTAGELLAGVGSIIAAIGLIVYERYFLKKTKDVGYL
ncbi:MAG TPA: hypothetical protein VFE51_03040 [Verrucomicrobiae bacterium]|nr:hypothetical protein [Verrucomicrobiae bacterium]